MCSGEIEEEPQRSSGLQRMVGVAGALAVAAAALLTAILLFQNANVGNDASPSPSSSAPAGGAPGADR